MHVTAPAKLVDVFTPLPNKDFFQTCEFWNARIFRTKKGVPARNLGLGQPTSQPGKCTASDLVLWRRPSPSNFPIWISSLRLGKLWENPGSTDRCRVGETYVVWCADDVQLKMRKAGYLPAAKTLAILIIDLLFCWLRIFDIPSIKRAGSILPPWRKSQLQAAAGCRAPMGPRGVDDSLCWLQICHFFSYIVVNPRVYHPQSR